MSGDPRVPVIIIIIYYLSPFTILCTCACSFLVAYFQSSKGLAFCFCLELHLKSDHGVGTVWGSCVKGQNNLEAKGVGNLDLTDVLTLTCTFIFIFNCVHSSLSVMCPLSNRDHQYGEFTSGGLS